MNRIRKGIIPVVIMIPVRDVEDVEDCECCRGIFIDGSHFFCFLLFVFVFVFCCVVDVQCGGLTLLSWESFCGGAGRLNIQSCSDSIHWLTLAMPLIVCSVLIRGDACARGL